MRVTDERSIRKAARGTLPAREFQVLMALAEYTDTKRRCFPSVRTVADLLGVSMDTIQRAFTALDKKGWITREERLRDDGGRTSSLITLLLPAEVVQRQAEALLRLPLMRVISGRETGSLACGKQGENIEEKTPPPPAKMPDPPSRKNAVTGTRTTITEVINSDSGERSATASPDGITERPRYEPERLPLSVAGLRKEGGVDGLPLRRAAG